MRNAREAEVDGNGPLPPGAALRRVARPHDTLDHKSAETPPWQDATAEHLSKELKAYKKDLLLTKANSVSVYLGKDILVGVIERQRNAI